MSFADYKGLDLVKIGNEVLDRWKKNHAFEKSLEVREGAPEFVFFEGPPSANGMPGIHHVMARSIKDSICRYKTQSGYKVNRRAGWDTHGLPVELGVEKMLGITKEDIGTKISVEEYNQACRKEVMKYTAEWVNMTERVGYWVDMNDPYITYDNRYIETLWYLLKKIYDKGLLYKGYSIQPYSPAAGTGLSTHELNQPGCYRDVKDTTATVQFEVIKDEKSQILYGCGTLPVFFLPPENDISNLIFCLYFRSAVTCLSQFFQMFFKLFQTFRSTCKRQFVSYLLHTCLINIMFYRFAHKSGLIVHATITKQTFPKRFSRFVQFVCLFITLCRFLEQKQPGICGTEIMPDITAEQCRCFLCIR